MFERGEAASDSERRVAELEKLLGKREIDIAPRGSRDELRVLAQRMTSRRSWLKFNDGAAARTK